MTVTFGLCGPPSGDDARGSGSALLRAFDEWVDVLGPEFTTLWVSDHFQREAEPTFECWTLISYLASRYEHLSVGTMVLGQGYRNPALLAKMAATLQFLTEGRLVLGLGAGWKEDELLAYGYGFPSAADRVDQLAEAITILQLMWQGGPATFHGRHYSIDEAYCRPVPAVPIPLLIGSDGKRVVRLAAEKADAWNWDASPDLFYEPLRRLQDAVASSGRVPGAVRITAGANVEFPEDASKFVRSFPSSYPGYEELVHGPTPAEAIESLRPFVEAGVTHVMVNASDLRTVRLFAEQVAPALAS